MPSPQPDGAAAAGSRSDRSGHAALKLINTSRGGLVDQNALLAALQRERISAAGLDVFESEPLPADHPLRFLPNVVATPHIGGGSKEIEIKELEATMSNIERFLSGIRPERLINASILNEARARARDLADAPA